MFHNASSPKTMRPGPTAPTITRHLAAWTATSALLCLAALPTAAQDLNYPFKAGVGPATPTHEQTTHDPAFVPSNPQAQRPGRADTTLPDAVLAALVRANVPASAMSALVVPISGPEAERLSFQADRPVNPATACCKAALRLAWCPALKSAKR